MAVRRLVGGADDEDAIPWRSPTFQIILGTMVTGVMGISVIAPALPTIRSALEITSAQAGIILTVFTLPGIVLAPLVGILSDRHGRRTVLVPCLLLFGVAGVAITFTKSYPVIVGLRLLQGVGGSGLTTLAITLIGDFFEGHRRNAVMGINSAVLAVGTATFPIIGGFLAEVAWDAPFLVHGSGVLLGLVAIRSLKEPDLDETPRGIQYLQGAVESVSTRDAIVLYGFAFGIFVTVYGVLLTILPFLLRELHALGSSRIGLVLTTSSIMSGVVASQNGRLARRFTNEQLIVVGIAAHGTSLLAMVVHTTALTIVPAVMLFGAGSGLAIPSLNTAVSDLTSGQYRGGAISLRTSVIRLGQSAGPVLFVGAVGIVDFRPTLLGAGSVLVVVAFAMGALRTFR